MSEDESQVWSDEIQALTDKMTLSIENFAKRKTARDRKILIYGQRILCVVRVVCV